MRDVKVNVYTIKLISYLYLAVPILIFFMGWLKFLYGFTASILLIAAIFISVKRDTSFQKQEYYHIPLTFIIASVLIAFVWLIMSGFGGFVWQREDWQARNAVLHDLIDNRWPVVFEDGGGLVYYICYFCVPAIVGKLLGWGAANAALFLYSMLGIMLVLFLLLDQFKDANYKVSAKRAYVVILFLILWGGLNVIGQLLVFLKGKGTMSPSAIYGWTAYQYTPNTALLEWVFNQSIPAWLGATIFLQERKSGNIGSYGLIVMLLIPFTPFAALGAIPLFFADIIKQKGRGLISVANILSALSVLPIFFIYFTTTDSLSGNSSMKMLGLFRLDNVGIIYNAFVLAVFLVVEVGIYAFLIWKRNRHDYLFIISVIWLLIIPLIRIGIYDKRMFLMRGSIIPLFILMMYVGQTILDSEFRKNKVMFAALLLSIVIGFYSGVGDIALTVMNTANPDIVNVADRVKSMNNNSDEAWNAYMNGVSYVVKNAEDTFFFGKLGR